MSVDVAIARSGERVWFGRMPGWAWCAIGFYALTLINGVVLLNDSDTYWQIKVGRWILDHAAMPHVDFYSFTKPGEVWISSSWLAQVLYAESFGLAGGWAGPVVLASASIAIAFAYLCFLLGSRIPATAAVTIAFMALLLSNSHVFARPHVLAWPIMLAWTAGLVSASERGEAPRFLLLPLMTLWANLHGGFLFGLILVGGFAVDALWNADAPKRMSLFMRWFIFGAAALLACCVTPYGWGSILASLRILDLGELLHIIGEWTPVDFGALTPFEIYLMMMLGAALYYGVVLSPPRILLLLGLLHMALAHNRNIENFVLLSPLVVLGPVAARFGLQGAWSARPTLPPASAALLALFAGLWTWAYTARVDLEQPSTHSPAAAVDMLTSRNPKHILNDLPFAGYLIWRDVPVFVDGRAELYGEKFEMDYYRALTLKDVGLLFDLLKRYDIDAVILKPSTPAAGLFDHLAGWQRIYADDNAVVHLRTGDGSANVLDPSHQ